MTAKIIQFTAKRPKEQINEQPEQASETGETPETPEIFDPDGSEFLNDRAVQFLDDIALLIQEYEIDTGRLVSANLVVHSTDKERYVAYAYCREADTEDGPTPDEYYDVAMMLPGLDMLDALSPYPPPDDDEFFGQVWEDHKELDDHGYQYNIWGGQMDYDSE